MVPQAKVKVALWLRVSSGEQHVEKPTGTDQANYEAGGSRFKGLNVKDLAQAGCLFAQGRGPAGQRPLW
jgi:hypothetical protein